MNVTWNEIEISYKEEDNRWHFELRGRKRSAESLVMAKQIIDREPVAKRKQEFPRFDAWLLSYRSDGERGTVTSVAYNGASYRTGVYFWIQNAKGDRSKESSLYLFPVNDKNDALIGEIKAMNAEIAAIAKRIDRKKGQLTAAEIPAEIAS